jgi:hypothetical protein
VPLKVVYLIVLHAVLIAAFRWFALNVATGMFYHKDTATCAHKCFRGVKHVIQVLILALRVLQVFI